MKRLEGWIKLHRKILNNPVVCKDADHLAVWVYLLLHASHDTRKVLFRGKKIDLKPGQLITGRKTIAAELGIHESKTKRILLLFESDQQIDRRRSNGNSLITILNWEKYQSYGQQNDQPVTSQWTASDQPVTTNKNEKNEKNEINIKDIVSAGTSPGHAAEQTAGTSPGLQESAGTSPGFPEYKAVVDYLNLKAGTAYRSTSKDTQRCIKARLAEGFTVEDFKHVIDVKCEEWGHKPGAGEKDMRPYLRPSTLFGTKFESYLNQKGGTRRTANKFNNFSQRDYDFAEYEKKLLERGGTP